MQNGKAIPFRTINAGAMMFRARGMMGFPSTQLKNHAKAWNSSITKEQSVGDRERSLYIHIPFCKSRCHFCHFYLFHGDRQGIKNYTRLLTKELETASEDGLSGLLVNAVYFGGGTPSDLAPEDFERLLSTIRRCYRLSNDCEITVEGRIAGFDEDKIKACIDGGVNRFSIGVQTFDTKLRHSIGRKSSRKQVIAKLEKLMSFKQAAVVIDLLYGLPGQTLEQWSEDLRTVVEDVKLSGLDQYHLGIHPGLPISSMIDSGQLKSRPDEKTRYEMFKLGEEAMANVGAQRLSVKHFSFDWRERNANNDIAVRKLPCLPFGVHAAGRLGDCMFQQVGDLTNYRELVERGRKPLAYAGKVPSDFVVCSEIAGQISRRMAINIQKAAALDGKREKLILELCAPVLLRWLNEENVSCGHLGWMRFTSKALFKHRIFASELMEAVAQAYKEILP